MLTVGDAAPSFTLSTPDGEISLDELISNSTCGVIIYFYPAAMTPGCTTEACDFRDSLTSLQQAGYSVVGISPDTTKKLAKFAARDHLTFPLASDPDHAVATAYGAWGEKKNYGKLFQGLIRSTFVVDRTGHITHTLRNVRATGHVARLLKELDLTA